jgi:hypothetical protein
LGQGRPWGDMSRLAFGHLLGKALGLHSPTSPWQPPLDSWFWTYHPHLQIPDPEHLSCLIRPSSSTGRWASRVIFFLRKKVVKIRFVPFGPVLFFGHVDFPCIATFQPDIFCTARRVLASVQALFCHLLKYPLDRKNFVRIARMASGRETGARWSAT